MLSLQNVPGLYLRIIWFSLSLDSTQAAKRNRLSLYLNHV